MNLEYWMNGISKRYKALPLTITATFWFAFCAFLQKAFVMLTTPIFTRLMSTEEYGEYATYISVINILGVVMTLNISSVLATKGMNRYKKKSEQFLFNIQLLSSCSVLFFATIILLTTNANMFFLFGFNRIIICIALAQIFVTPAYEIWSAKQRYEYNYKKVLIFTCVYIFLNTIFGVSAVALSPNKGDARIISYCIVHILLYGILYINNMKAYSEGISKEMLIFSLKFNAPLIPQGVANQILARSDILMIRLLQGIEQSGIYSLGYNIASIIVVLTSSINNVYVPWLYRKMDAAEYGDIKEKSTYMIIFIFMCVSVMIIVAPEMVYIFAPSTYKKAIYVIAPVAVGIAFTMVYTLFVNIELYFEKTAVVMSGTIVVTIVNILLNNYFIPIYGFIVAAYTTLVSYIGYAIIHYLFSKRLCKDKVKLDEIYDLKKILLISIIQLFVLIVVVVLYPYRILRFFMALFGVISVMAFFLKIRKVHY